MANIEASEEGDVLKCDTCGRLVGRIKATASSVPKMGLGIEFLRFRLACPSCGRISCDRCAKGRLLCQNCLDRMSNGAYQRIIEYRRIVMTTVSRLLLFGTLPWLLAIVGWVPFYLYVMAPLLDTAVASTIFIVGDIIVAVWVGWFVFNLLKGALLPPIIFKKIVATVLARGEQVVDTLLDPALCSPKHLWRTLRYGNVQQVINADDVGTYLKGLREL